MSQDAKDMLRTIKYLAQSDKGQRVRLGDLADQLMSYRQATVIELLDLGLVVLYQNDNPLDITSADDAAKVVLPSGSVRHLVYLA